MKERKQPFPRLKRRMCGIVDERERHDRVLYARQFVAFETRPERGSQRFEPLFRAYLVTLEPETQDWRVGGQGFLQVLWRNAERSARTWLQTPKRQPRLAEDRRQQLIVHEER